VLSSASLPINVQKPQDSRSVSLPPVQRVAGNAGQIAAAYDALAGDYDSQLARAQWIRARLWDRLDVLFPAGSKVLDVTAGTGLDAVHLLDRGVQVVAGDLSSEMLAQLTARAAAVDSRVLNFNRLDHEKFDQKFDGIISTFAGLNTSADLRPFAASAAALLEGGGVLFVHLLNRWPALEILGSFFQLNWRAGWNSLVSKERMVKFGEMSVPHYLYSPLSLYRHVFAPYFHLQRIEAQGLLAVPDSNAGSFIRGLEGVVARRPPFYFFGTFFSLQMVRK
jgi:SAM-dependent methyltransferase